MGGLITRYLKRFAQEILKIAAINYIWEHYRDPFVRHRVVGNAIATVLNSNKVDKPKLFQYQFAVGQAEFSTGYVLKNNKSLYLVGEHISDACEIFNSYDEAREFSIKQVNDNPEIECYVYDYNEQVLFICDKDGERNL